MTNKGYNFTLKELVDHLEDGIPLSDERLEAVAGGKSTNESVSALTIAAGVTLVGVGGIFTGILCDSLKEH